MTTKILHVFGTAEARDHWLNHCAFLSPTVTVMAGRKPFPWRIVFRDGTTLDAVVIDNTSSPANLAGQEFSAVFEHSSFWERPDWWESTIKPRVRG